MVSCWSRSGLGIATLVSRDSLEDYVEDVLQETDFYRNLEKALERVPEDLRQYVTVDVEGISDAWEQGLHVMEAPGGKVWVFDTRS